MRFNTFYTITDGNEQKVYSYTWKLLGRISDGKLTLAKARLTPDELRKLPDIWDEVAGYLEGKKPPKEETYMRVVYSVQEYAEKFGVPEGTVRTWIYRGLNTYKLTKWHQSVVTGIRPQDVYYFLNIKKTEEL